jgi:hypothetical protein
VYRRRVMQDRRAHRGYTRARSVRTEVLQSMWWS